MPSKKRKEEKEKKQTATATTAPYALSKAEEVDKEQESMVNRFYALVVGRNIDILSEKAVKDKFINLDTSKGNKTIDDFLKKTVGDSKLARRLELNMREGLADLWRNAWMQGEEDARREIYTNYKTSKGNTRSLFNRFDVKNLIEFATPEEENKEWLKEQRKLQKRLVEQLIGSKGKKRKGGFLSPAAFDVTGRGSDDPFKLGYYNTLRAKDIEEKARTASQGQFVDSNEFAKEYLEKRNLYIARRYTKDYQEQIKNNMGVYLRSYRSKKREANLFEELVGSKDIARINRELTQVQKTSGNPELRITSLSQLSDIEDDYTLQLIDPPLPSSRRKRIEKAINENDTAYLDKVKARIRAASETQGLEGNSLQERELSALLNPNNKKLAKEVSNKKQKFKDARRLNPLFAEAEEKIRNGQTVDLNETSANRNRIPSSVYNDLVKNKVIDPKEYPSDYEFSPWQVRKLKEKLTSPDTRTRNKYGLTQAEAAKVKNENIYARVERIAYTEVGMAYNMGRLNKFLDEGVEYVQWVATLDTRTSVFCQSRNGAVKALAEVMSSFPPSLTPFPNTRKPATEADGWFIPAHPYCRSYWQPIVGKNKEELKQMMLSEGAVDAAKEGIRAGTVVTTLLNVARVTNVARQLLAAKDGNAAANEKLTKQMLADSNFLEGFLLGGAMVATPIAAYYFFSKSKFGQTLKDVVRDAAVDIGGDDNDREVPSTSRQQKAKEERAKERMEEVVNDAMEEIREKVKKEYKDQGLITPQQQMKALKAMAEEEMESVMNDPAMVENLKMVSRQVKEDSDKVLNLLDTNDPNLQKESLNRIVDRIVKDRQQFLSSGQQLAAAQRQRMEAVLRDADKLKRLYQSQEGTGINDVLKERLYGVSNQMQERGLALAKNKKLATLNNKSINDLVSEMQAKINTAEKLIQENPQLKRDLDPLVQRLKKEKLRVNNFLNYTKGYKTTAKNNIGKRIERAEEVYQDLREDVRRMETDLDTFRGETGRLIREIDELDDFGLAIEPNVSYSGQFFQNLYNELKGRKDNLLRQYGGGLDADNLDDFINNNLSSTRKKDLRSSVRWIKKQENKLKSRGIELFDSNSFINSELEGVNKTAQSKLNNLQQRLEQIREEANRRGYSIDLD